MSRRSDRLNNRVEQETPTTDPLDNEFATLATIAPEPATRRARHASYAAPQDAKVTAVLERLTALAERQASPSEFTTPMPEVSVTTGRGPEARSPDRFDGASPSKLRPFLTQCRLVFLNHPKRFNTDRAKVLYAGSFLSGTAADWFEPFTLDNADEAVVLDSWQLFHERIERIFGDSNSVATAEHNIDTLYMRDNQQINDYITRFRTYSAQLKWDDQPLMYAFRKGLANRILDELARIDSPANLSDLMEVSLKIDNRHWERERERKLHPRASNAHGAQTSAPSRKPFSSTTVVKKEQRTYAQPARPDQSSSYNSSKPKKDLDKILNNDGKVNAAEKARRSERGLCNYCGGPHKIDDCPVRPKGNIPGRRAAASAAHIASDTSSGQAKN